CGLQPRLRSPPLSLAGPREISAAWGPPRYSPSKKGGGDYERITSRMGISVAVPGVPKGLWGPQGKSAYQCPGGPGRSFLAPGEGHFSALSRGQARARQGRTAPTQCSVIHQGGTRSLQCLRGGPEVCGPGHTLAWGLLQGNAPTGDEELGWPIICPDRGCPSGDWRLHPQVVRQIWDGFGGGSGVCLLLGDTEGHATGGIYARRRHGQHSVHVCTASTASMWHESALASAILPLAHLLTERLGEYCHSL
ncbi:hypothetical protein CRENBAI_012877, partial [Crenichthys baileyi]